MMADAATITLTCSSHPEFKFFAEMRADGRQIGSRFVTRAAMDAWVARAEAGARRAGRTVTIIDNARTLERDTP